VRGISEFLHDQIGLRKLGNGDNKAGSYCGCHMDNAPLIWITDTLIQQWLGHLTEGEQPEFLQ
jgi:hypothetical protein